MAFDFKKEYKEFYLPKNTPSIVTVPAMNYIAVRGHGDPNEEEGAYKQAIGLLYGIAFTIKMSKKDFPIWESTSSPHSMIFFPAKYRLLSTGCPFLSTLASKNVRSMERASVFPKRRGRILVDKLLVIFIADADLFKHAFVGTLGGPLDVSLEFIVSLTRINHDSSYSKENPIRTIDSIKKMNAVPGYCGHCCVVMLAGISLQDVQKVMGKADGSWSKIKETLDYYGICYSEKMVYPKGKNVSLPKCCIVYADGGFKGICKNIVENYGQTVL